MPFVIGIGLMLTLGIVAIVAVVFKIIDKMPSIYVRYEAGRKGKDD